MKLNDFYIIILGLFFLMPKAMYAVDPPVITATGNQTYCAGTSLKIVTDVRITHDLAETGTAAIEIQIASGYVFGQDILTLANGASHPKITADWVPSEGKLRLFNPSGIQISYADFEKAIKDVEFSNSSATPSGTRNFSINIGFGGANYLPRNGHFYEYVASPGITWTSAEALAREKKYYGLQGYLATLTAADEAQLCGAQAPGAGWIGGSDADSEGVWKWVTGPEAGITFWIGNQSGAATPPFNYANWNPSFEPNNANNEDYAHIRPSTSTNPGTWNDLPNPGTSGDYYPRGYIVEYGGMFGDPILQISASTKITIPKITSTPTSSVCGSGSLTLQATATDGTVKWYDLPTGGTLLNTGNTFTTPNLTATTSYYVDATNGSCPSSPRTEVIATVNPIPTITATSPAFRCDIGTVTLGAVPSVGTVNWYDVSTGGTILGTGTSFTTPSISLTTTYYVDATASSCTTPTRTAIIATVNISPKISSYGSLYVCNSGKSTLNAVFTKGIVNWYDVPSGGTSLGTGNFFTTPILTESTTFYVDATDAGCTTPVRRAVPVTVNKSPTITSTTPASRCDSGSVTLEAIATIKNSINWYDVPTGGTPLGSGSSFTTPILTTSKTYYVDAETVSGCTTPTRIAITATINTIPTVTLTIPASRCDTGTVTLSADASAGTINWYDQPIGGTSLGTGTSFTTPNLTSTTTYYVDATTNGCPSPRLPVMATIYPVNALSEEVLLCQSKTAILDASIPGMDYLWTPNGETSQTIVVSNIGDYGVIISSPLANCDSKKDFKVIEHPKPIIKEILIDENSIKIELEHPESYYEFSIDGEIFQNSNQFSYISSGQHIAYIREKNGCNLVEQDFTIFTIAKYFTPNSDGFNDVWEIKEMKNFPNSRVEIFNRYGKLLKQLNYRNSGWNGTFNGLELPADDYWYVLKLADSKPEIKGHFSLKR